MSSRRGGRGCAACSAACVAGRRRPCKPTWTGTSASRRNSPAPTHPLAVRLCASTGSRCSRCRQASEAPFLHYLSRFLVPGRATTIGVRQPFRPATASLRQCSRRFPSGGAGIGEPRQAADVARGVPHRPSMPTPRAAPRRPGAHRNGLGGPSQGGRPASPVCTSIDREDAGPPPAGPRSTVRPGRRPSTPGRPPPRRHPPSGTGPVVPDSACPTR